MALRLRSFGFAHGHAANQIGRRIVRAQGWQQTSDVKMKQMRQFLTTLVVVWTAACIATYIYSQQQNIPSWIALAVLPAFLVEFAFYLAPGFADCPACV